MEWLAIYHPEALPDDFLPNNYGDSVVPYFSHILPEEPMEVIEQGSPDGHMTSEARPEVYRTRCYLMAETSTEAIEQDSSHNHVTPQALPNVTEQDCCHSSPEMPPEGTEQGTFVIVTSVV